MIAASDQLKHYLHDRYEGRDMGISAVGTFGYLFAFTIVLYLLIKHIFHSNFLVTYKGSIGDSRHDALNRKSSVKNKYNNCLVTCKQQWYNVKSLSGQKNICGGTVRKRKAV